MELGIDVRHLIYKFGRKGLGLAKVRRGFTQLSEGARQWFGMVAPHYLLCNLTGLGLVLK